MPSRSIPCASSQAETAHIAQIRRTSTVAGGVTGAAAATVAGDSVDVHGSPADAGTDFLQLDGEQDCQSLLHREIDVNVERRARCVLSSFPC